MVFDLSRQIDSQFQREFVTPMGIFQEDQGRPASSFFEGNGPNSRKNIVTAKDLTQLPGQRCLFGLQAQQAGQ